MQDKTVQQNSTLQSLLQNKNLSADLFNPQPIPTLSLDSPLSDHVRWAFENIYSIPYASEKYENLEIQREIHGIQHVTRVAFFTQIFANLYRKHGDKEAVNLTEEDIKLLQIAALFHDAGREDEGRDETDHESGLLLYFYLRNILKVDKEKAKLIAEATANKDLVEGKKSPCFEINEDENGHVSSGFVLKSASLTIFHKIIHDADCLDILRARLCFDAHYLHFYQCIASNPENKIAFEEMAHLIIEARSLIHLQGDSFDRIIIKLKKKFENENAFDALKNSIEKERHPILTALGNTLISLEELQKINLLYPKSDDKFQFALDNCQLFARSIGSPSAIIKNKSTKPEETAAQLENRKNMRTPNIATRTQKSNRKTKHGNLNRSISMLGFGMPPFADAGGVILGLNKNSISKVSASDFGSGRAKKADIVNEYLNQPELLEKALNELEKTIKMGGKIAENCQYTHTELLYGITKFDAFYYCNCPNLYSNHLLYNSTRGMRESTHPFSPLLQAIYLQKQYEIQYEETQKIYESTFGKEAGFSRFIERLGSNKKLPIIEYSAVHHEIRIVNENELTDEKIIQMWTKMCSSYLQEQLQFSSKDMNCLKAVYEANVDTIKTCSMYGVEEHLEHIKRHTPADGNYDSVLVQKINQSIEKERANLMRTHELKLLAKIRSGSLSIFSENIAFICLKSEFLQIALQKEIFLEIEKGMQAFKQACKRLDKDERKYYKKIKDFSKIFFLDNHLNTIQEQIGSLFLELLKKTRLDFRALTHQVKRWHTTNKPIDDLIGLIEQFELEPSAREQVGSLMSEVLIYASNQFSKFENVDDYADLVEKMHKHGFLKPQHSALIQKVYEESAELLESGQYEAADIQSHLRVEKFVKDDQKNIINNLLNWLCNTQEPLQQEDFRLFAQYLHNQKIFKKILDKIQLPKDIADAEWVDIILELKDQEILNSQQIELLTIKWNELCKQYVKFSGGLFDQELSFVVFTNLLIKARNAKLPVDIFETTLERILKTEYENVLALTKNNMNEILLCLSSLDWLSKESGKPKFLSLVKKFKTIEKVISENDFSNPLFFQSKNLVLAGQPLTNYTIEKFLLPVLEHYAKEIEVIDFSSCGLNNKNLYLLVEAIGKLKNLKILNISNNDIDNSGAEDLIKMLPHEIDLNIYSNPCDPEEIQEMLDNKFKKKESYQHLKFFPQTETGQTQPVQTFKAPNQ